MTLRAIIAVLAFCAFVSTTFGQRDADSVYINRQNPFQAVDSTKKEKRGRMGKKRIVQIKRDSLVSNVADTLVADSLLSDTTTLPTDSAVAPVFDSLQIQYADDDLEDPIQYKAVDSIVYHIDSNIIYLYDDADISYQDINLQADYVYYDWETNVLTAEGMKDSAGNISGTPVFSDNNSPYKAKGMSYNFKTKKGKVREVIIEEDQSYIHVEEGKMNEREEWYGKKVKYTTCNHEDPHFYIRANKVKMVPGELMVTGPANLVIADIPTPLYIPFGIFPTKEGQRSGIIPPSYGEFRDQGFYLKDGGYYWVINESVALQITGEIYTKGSWGIRTRTSYNKKYKGSGGLALSYFRRSPVDKDIPGASGSNDFSINWNHNQSAKARPNSSFSASVNARTSTFKENSFTTDRTRIESVITSSISYSRRKPGKPYSFTMNLNHNQNLRTGQLTIDFPVVNFTVSRITPFKAKVSTGKKKWYEKLGFNYRFEAKNQLSTIDSLLFTSDIVDKLAYGIRQATTIDAPLEVFKYFTLRPSFNYTERWYFQQINKTWNPDTVVTVIDGEPDDTIYGQVETDTSFGFFPVRNFSTSISLSTKVIGIYNFRTKNVKGFKHVMTPSLSFNYTPDFGADRWGYYETVQSSADGDELNYSPYDIVRSVYGVPGRGRVGSLGFNFNNNFEMKIATKDTVEPIKKVGILDRLNLSMNYNFVADSLELSPLNISGSSRISKNLNFTFRTLLDPYITDSNNRKINTFVWQDRRRFFRMTNTNFSLDFNMSSRNKKTRTATTGTQDERDYVLNNPQEYYDFNIPWSFTAGYNLNLTRGISGNPDTTRITQSIEGRADFNLTPNWKFDISSAYDITKKELQLTNVRIIRNLHCWELSFNWTAWPRQFQNYAIELRVKSSILQELKLSKRTNPGQGGFF